MFENKGKLLDESPSKVIPMMVDESHVTSMMIDDSHVIPMIDDSVDMGVWKDGKWVSFSKDKTEFKKLFEQVKEK